MPERLEKLIRTVYKIWKVNQPVAKESHPDEETMACFLENKLSAQESDDIKAHLISCDTCAEVIAVQLKLKAIETKEIPEAVLIRVKNLVTTEDKASILEIFLSLKEKALELLHTSGDVLVGQELVPAPILRSRQIKDFRDEVTILKDFQNIRVEVKIENKLGRSFSLSVVVKEKSTQRVMKDLRVTLIKDDLEFESCLSDSGKVTFEHVLLGKYTVEISTVENKLASILLDIKV
ncbi:MAG: hypothetical protein Q8O30_09125 [Candidatus Omnitrophota bacterium]|nr:hypothetical protein [Candidatus Omnitrophota bacterium]